MVAERSVSRWRFIEKYIGGIRSENADMSSEKHVIKYCRRKFKGFFERLIRKE